MGINRNGAEGTLAAMQQAARPDGGGHDFPQHEHPDLNEIADDHADHLTGHAAELDAHHARLEHHDTQLDDHAARLTKLEGPAVHGRGDT